MTINQLGNPLGNPLAEGRWQPAATTYTRIVSGSGVLIPPQGARFMRVAVIGGGGGGRLSVGSYNIGGGGGGCAASKIVPAVPITYSIGAGGLYQGNSGQLAQNGGDTTASFGAYSLVGGGGGGGGSGPSSRGPGGAGAGGDYNFSGGFATYANSASISYGGGAAGPNGNGGNGGVQSSAPVLPTVGDFAGTGWGAGGGAGGMAGGGSGTGALSYSGSVTLGGQVWGLPSMSSTAGEMGGGADGSNGANGGSGGMVVEWFY